jgi:hypothetical protein
MKKKIAIAAGLAAIGVAGCGSTKTVTVTSQQASAPTTSAAPTDQSVADYLRRNLLPGITKGTSMKVQYVGCTHVGGNTFTCSTLIDAAGTTITPAFQVIDDGQSVSVQMTSTGGD